MTEAYFVILPEPGERRCLLLPAEGGWTLPRAGAAPTELALVGPVNRAVAEQYGVTVTVLRCLFPREENFAAVAPYRIYELENHHSSGWAPPAGARWVGAGDLAGLPLAEEEHRPVLAGWLAGEEAHSVDWTWPGWFGRAAAWIQAQPGIHPIGPTEQVKIWQASCILRVPTAEGDLYLKASPPSTPAEAPLGVALDRWFPGRVPAVVAHDLEQGWTLTRDFGRTLLGDTRDAGLCETALRTYAGMQIGCVTRTEELRALSCYDRRLPVLSAQLAQMCADAPALRGRNGLSVEEIARLRAIEPDLHEALAELDGCGIPPTLEHGDFHAWNIAVPDGRPVIFDWSDGCLTHPFFGLRPFLDFLEVDGPTRERLIAAYLQEWSSFGTPAHLREACDLALKVAPLYMALAFYAYILPAMADREAWLGGQTHWLRKLLAEMESGD